MEKKKKRKVFVAWSVLFLLIFLLLYLNYVKFFGLPNENIEERPVENSTEQAIQMALQEIVNNFNNNEEIVELEEKNVKVQATLNQHSIFINYEADNITTYEFAYNQLNLSITINNTKENLDKFNQVYRILLKAIQERINNTDQNVDGIIDDIVIENQDYVGFIKEESDKNVFYKINITKKLTEQLKINKEEDNKEINIKEENVIENQ